jgi:paraquat-inducible protein B
VPVDPQMPEPANLPQALSSRRSSFSPQLIWLIPLVALLIGGWLAVKTILERGPTITITFRTADGIVPGKTSVKYKNVEIGVVKSVAVADDLKSVIVTAELVKATEKTLSGDSRFWVEHARISGSGVSGLATLLSGPYIAVDVGHAENSGRRSFVGLEIPPVIVNDVPGREFVLHAKTLGSLDFGSPVYFRRLQVGQVAGYDLDANGRGVTLKIFVDSPYDRYVTAGTHFWHASGIDMSLDAGGFRIATESLASILIGGLAFDTPEKSASGAPANADAEFRLYHSREAAEKSPDRLVEPYVLVFKESVRGLSVGAPVDFRGIVIGEVAAIDADYDLANGDIRLPVEIHLYPDRLRSRDRKLATNAINPRELLDKMVKRGFRAQLRMGNLLTGQAYVALDRFPDAAPAKVNWSKSPAELPTVPGSLQDLQAAVTSIAKKLDRLPLDSIGANLDKTLVEARQLLHHLDSDIAPELKATLHDLQRTLSSAEHTLSPDAPLQADAREAMRELAAAAAAFRQLADYLEQHPEALLRGKKGDAK